MSSSHIHDDPFLTLGLRKVVMCGDGTSRIDSTMDLTMNTSLLEYPGAVQTQYAEPLYSFVVLIFTVL